MRRLRLGEVRLLLEAQWLLVHCQVLRWIRPVGRLVAVAGPRDGEAPGRRDVATVRAVAWGLTRAARYGLFRPRCLVRSLALQRMLRRHGVEDAELRIGVRVVDGGFGAHAWVELDGRVVGDDPAHVATFVPATDLELVQI
ncbi:MAG TPA: lasso peptide biosynthesis B2 protein [Longimicrobiales bacterium]|nr:lasso peptide biosynthesis B2 protein [Longimicrobiales bacterium]